VWLEISTQLLCRYRMEPETFSAADLRNLTTLLSKMGMSPVDRQRVSVPPVEEQSIEDKYFT
jgi:hypothetical protein